MPDAVVMFLGNMDLFWLIAALGGGALGALIGANYAFGMVGVLIIVGLGVAAGTGNTMLLDYGAFGPLFGPHIAFSGGQIAAAYAGYRGCLKATGGGKDVNTPLISIDRPDVIIVGALGGAAGYVLQKLFSLIPWFGNHTDSVALTVFTMGVLCRIIWGKTPVFKRNGAPVDGARWLNYQERPAQYLTLGAFVGIAAAGLSMMLASYIKPLGLDDATYTQIIDNAHVLPFAISAITVLLLASGVKMPVTHHITITAAVAAMTYYKIAGNGFMGLIIGAIAGMAAAALAELVARLTYYHGDTHIDAPAGAIWPLNTAVALCAIPFVA